MAAVALSKLLAALRKNSGLKTSTDFLVAHSFIHQGSSGVFDLLPLCLRIEHKISAIVRDRLDEAGCIESALSTLVNPDLWRASGRLSDNKESGKEFMFTEGRKHLLAPTAEEQIADLMRNVSYKSLPLSFYQITRKFRNELRPRGGLLRTREFLMKDLYTFDLTSDLASQSYARVRRAYDLIFADLGLSVVTAEADSGDMGGDYSHEYHLPHAIGEDMLVSCPRCNYLANSETAVSKAGFAGERVEVLDAAIPSHRTLSPPLLAKARKSGATLVDWRLNPSGAPLVVPEEGDRCVHCDAELEFRPSIEVGHTFLLGKRYTEPLKVTVNTPGATSALEMGCYGIGISRLVSAIAEVYIDEHGLRWPRSVAPFTCAVVSKDFGASRALAEFLDANGVDACYEDRTTQVGFAIRDAREKGIPYTLVAGSDVEVLYRDGRPSVRVPQSQVLSCFQ